MHGRCLGPEFFESLAPPPIFLLLLLLPIFYISKTSLNSSGDEQNANCSTN